jgi:DNA-binding LacI/PurR family transcriptional regulator
MDSSRRRNVSIADVAALARVSQSTVSRVINGNIPVEEATRKRVDSAIQILSFKPNLLAKGLRKRSGHLVGLVVPETVHHTFASFIQFIEESCLRLGYNLILGNHQNDPDLEESLIDNFVRRNVDGIIFSRVSDESRAMRIISRTGVPAVVIDRAIEKESLSSVVIDNTSAGTLAAEHLCALGHTRIGCITGSMKISLCRERLSGFANALEAKGIALDERWVVEGDFGFESGVSAGRSLFEREQGLTAIWAQNDLMAVGAIKYLMSRGISVPRDVSIVGMDDISLARMITPSLTTVVQPFAEICQKAVELLLRQTDEKPQRVVLQPTIAIRESTRTL